MAIFTKKKRDPNTAPNASPPLAQQGQFSRSQSGHVGVGSIGSAGGSGILQHPGQLQHQPQQHMQQPLYGSAGSNGPAPTSSTSILTHSNSQNFPAPPPSTSTSNLPPSASNPAPGPAAPSGHTVLYPWAQRRLHYLPSALLPPIDPANPTAPISPIRGPISTPPFPRYGHSVNPIASMPNGDLYIFGGLVANAVKNDLYILGCAPGGSPSGTGAGGPQGTLSVGLVETRGEVPGPRVGHASVGVGNVLIVWGGDTKSRPEDRQDDSLYLLNLSTREWTRVKTHGPTPEGRYGHAAAMVGSRFFVFGGQKDDGGFMNDLVWFDLQKLKAGSPKWTFIDYQPGAVVPPKRTGHTTVTYGDSIYVFGGTDGQYHYNDTWAYDTNTQTWSELSCIGYIPVPREGHAATLVDDVMYVFGGRGVDGKDLEDLAAFKITNQRWFMFQNMGPAPSGRSGHAMATWQNKVYVLGGESYTSARADDPSFVHVLDTSKIKYPSGDRAPSSRKSSIPVASPPASEKNMGQNSLNNLPPQLQVHPPNAAPPANGIVADEDGRRSGTTSPTGGPRGVPPNGISPSFGQVITPKQHAAQDPASTNSKIAKRSTTGATSPTPVRPARPGDENAPQNNDPSSALYRRTMEPTNDPERAMSPSGPQPQQRSRAMSPAATSPTTGTGPRPRIAGSPPQQALAQFANAPSQGISAARGARSPSPNANGNTNGGSLNGHGMSRQAGSGSSDGGDHDLVVPNGISATASGISSPPPQDAFYYPPRPQTNGTATATSPGGTPPPELIKAKDAEIAELKSREAWMKTALALATRRGFVTHDAVDEADAQSLEKLQPALEDGTNRQVVTALLQLKQELAKAKVAVAEQAQSVDERVAAATRSRTAALQEASYYRAKLVALESGSIGDVNKLERERTLDLEKRLAESLAAKTLLERQVEKLSGDVDHHIEMRASIEERHEAATSRADAAESSYSRSLSDYAELQRRANGHESMIQEHLEQIAGLHSTTQQLEAENATLKHKVEVAEISLAQYIRTMEETQVALVAANLRSDEVHGIWEQSQAELQEQKSQAMQLQSDLDAKNVELRTVNDRVSDLERVLKATRDEHEATKVLAAGGLAELVAAHRERESKSRDIPPDEASSERVQALEEETTKIRQLHQDVRTKHDASLAELDASRSREVQLHTQVAQLKSEVASLRNQHAQALDEVRSHKSLAADRDAETREQTRTREAADVKVSLLRHIMADHGLSVNDDDLAARFPPMTGNETPEQLHHRVQELEGRLEQRTRAHQELEVAHEESRRELVETEQRFRDASHQRDVTDEQLNGEGARAAKAEEDLEALQARHRQLESTHLKAVQYVKGTEKMLRRMKEELTRHKERNEELETEAGSHAGPVGELRAELDSVRMQLRDLSLLSTKASSENEELQHRLLTLQSDYEHRLRDQQTATTAEVNHLQDELQKLDQELDKAQHELEETHAINASLNHELTSALKGGSQTGLAEELAAAQKKTEWLKRENAQLETRCETAEQKISILLDHMEGENGSAEDGVSGENYNGSPASHNAAHFDARWSKEDQSDGGSDYSEHARNAGFHPSAGPSH